jgi:SAM-dependent methyltransferase
VRNWSAALDFWPAHSTQKLADCTALELGSRNGGLSLWLALQGAHVICSDIDPPTEAALHKHQQGGVADRIEYRSISALDIPYRNELDVVVFKSVLGALGTRERQVEAISQIHASLKKGGELFFAENLTASPFHRFFRRSFVAWGSRWRYVSIREMRTFLAPFSRLECRALGFAGAFGRNEAQRNVLGMIDQTVFNAVVPESWRYIIVGVATK